MFESTRSHSAPLVNRHARTRLGPLEIFIATGAAAVAALAVAGCGTGHRSPAELVVTSYSPSKMSEEASAPIQIQFDKPVVAASQVGVAVEKPPFTIAPEVQLSAHWLDRQTLVIEPAADLAPSTTYRVELVGDLAERTNGFGFSFVSRPLVVEGVWGVDPLELPPDPKLPIHFNQPVASSDVAAHCRLQPAAGGDPVELVAMTSGKPDISVTVEPKTALEQGKDYVLVCDELSGAGGDTGITEPYLLTLHTYPQIAVTRVAPDGWDVPADEVDIEVSFSTPVRLEDVREHLSAKPAMPGLENGWLDRSGTKYHVTVDLRTETEYTLEIAAGLADAYSQKLSKKRKHSFHTGDARPRLVLETGIYAVEPASQGYPIWTRNVGKFEVECARVPKDKVVKLLTSGMDYDPWYDASDRNVDWKKMGLLKRDDKVRIDQPKNKWHLTYLELDKTCGGHDKRGLYLANMHSDEVKLDDDNPWRYRPSRRVLANVTDLGILLKAGTASGLIWVSSISTGAPVGGAKASVYTPQGKLVFTGATDKDGILRLPGTTTLLAQPGARDKDEFEEDSYDDFYSYRSQRLIAVVEKGEEMGVIDGNWANGIQTWNFGVREDRRSGRTRIRGFIQSDRGLYRPGEKVHFKGIVREIEVGRAPLVPEKSRAAVTVEDSRGSTVFKKKLAISKFGGFSFDLGLPAESALGDYYVRATIKGQTFHERFMVEEFRKVSYEVALEPGKRHGRLGDKLAFDLSASYLFGAPVVGADVEWSLQRRPHHVSFAKYSQYDFADWASRGYYSYWGRHDSGYLSYISDGNGKTDKRGHLRFAIRDPQTNFDGPQDYLVHAAVTDETDQTVSKQVVVTAHKSDFYVGLHSQEFVQAVGMPFSINAVALDPHGSQVATKATLSLIREGYQCTYEGGFRSYQRCRTVHLPAMSREFQIPATGIATERIMPKHPGEYIIRVDATDSRGNKVSASSYVWILGKGEAFWSGDESARMSLIASKEKYRPGETARLVPRTNLKNATALVTLERNGILDAFVKKLDSANEGIEIPLEDLHAPNVYASVAMVTGRRGEGDRNRPRFKMGITELKVSSEKQRLQVEIETDKTSYEPGQKVTGTIRVTSQGKPVSAEVSLSVADEGVLQLIAYKTPDPMKTFYASWGMGIDSSTNWNRIARLNDPAVIDPDEGGDSGSDDGGQRIRSKFVSSAYWRPALLTDERGEIAFSFDAPDNLTAFRLMAVAADEGSRFGSGEGRVTIKKPLLAKPVLPRFLSAGDRSEVGVLVHNYTGAAGTATVTAKAAGARLYKTKRTVKIEKDGSARVRFLAKARDRKQAKFTFSVTMGDYSDALAVSLPINRPLVIEKRMLGRGEITPANGGKADVALAWRSGVEERDSMVTITVDRTGLGELEPSLRYLVEYPYGCLEQTLSRFIPLTKVKDLAGSLGLKELEGPKLKSFIRAGAAKVVRHQHADGHYSLWPSGPTYPHLTVYATYGLLEAKRAGVKVDESAIDRGVQAMRAWANSSDRKLGPGGESATVAMAAYVLAYVGKPDHGLDARLFEARRGLPRYGQAFLLRALHLAKADEKQIETLEDELLAAASASGKSVIVRETEPDLHYYMNSDVRSTAITLSALLEVDPKSAMVEQLAEGLKSQRRPSGRWMNTQDNLYALVALSDYARQKAKGEARVTLRLDGKRKLTRRIKGNKILVYRRALTKLRPGTLSIESKGKVRYSVQLTEARTDPAEKPLDNGFAVTRQYLDPETGAPLTAFAAGQLVKVKVQVTSNQDRSYVAVVDPLPAGFEAVNTRFATSQQRASAPSHRGYYGYYRYQYGWTHEEQRDDMVLGFADRMRAGTLTLEYLARATIPGSFMALPARAEAMYEPDINGRTASLAVSVKR